MEETRLCIMCGEEHKIQEAGNFTIYHCKNKKYKIHEAIIHNKDNIIGQRWLNAIYDYIERTPFINNSQNSNMLGYWSFYYEETDKVYDNEALVNVYQLMKRYPSNVIERIEHILINLSRSYPLLSDTFSMLEFERTGFRLLYCESEDREEEVESVFSALIVSGFIELAQNWNNIEMNRYRIAIKGWKRISELTGSYSIQDYGFIAMSFDPSVEYIQKAFKEAINQAGYEPRIIKDKEHNNYIMPEIFHEIEQSKFIVVDITKPNYGAYYEAGYAQALGKEVIVCCKEDVFKDEDTRPHFDIVQKSMILWTDVNDLIFRLKRRIEATVKK